MGIATREKVKMRTVYCLRVRFSDDDAWGQPTYYRTKAERDNDARVARIIGSMRTHSYEEKNTAEETAALFN